MISRRFRILVGALAILALGVSLSTGCGDNDSSSSTPDADDSSVVRVLSPANEVNGVGLESTSKLVVSTFGKPPEKPSAYPIDPIDADSDLHHPFSEITGPYDLSQFGPPDSVQKTFRYEGVSFLTVRGRVIAILLSGDAGIEGLGISIGDPLDTVKNTGEARCEAGYQGDTTAYRPAFCVVGKRRSTRIIFTGDPIESIMVLDGRYSI